MKIKRSNILLYSIVATMVLSVTGCTRVAPKPLVIPDGISSEDNLSISKYSQVVEQENDRLATYILIKKMEKLNSDVLSMNTSLKMLSAQLQTQTQDMQTIRERVNDGIIRSSLMTEELSNIKNEMALIRNKSENAKALVTDNNQTLHASPVVKDNNISVIQTQNDNNNTVAYTLFTKPKRLTVVGRAVNVHNLPDVNSTVTRFLRYGERVKVIGDTNKFYCLKEGEFVYKSLLQKVSLDMNTTKQSIAPSTQQKQKLPCEGKALVVTTKKSEPAQITVDDVLAKHKK